MNVPLIFCGQGWHRYFPSVIQSAMRYSPQTPVIVLGDAALRSRCPSAFDIADYADRSARFARVYDHCSTEDRWAVLTAIQRWYIVADFCARNSLKRVWCFDWDILTMCDLAAEAETLGEPPFTLPFQQLYTPDIRFLDPWLEAVEKLYTDRPFTAWYELHRRATAGDWARYGLCDYTLALWFFGTTGHVNLCDIRDGVASDGNLAHNHGGVFAMRDGAKDIVFREGIPFARTTQGGEVRLRTLHPAGALRASIPGWLAQAENSREPVVRS